MAGTTVVVVSDTHLRDRGPGGGPARGLPETLLDHLAGADLILHAGDVVEPGVLDRLRCYAPVHAVLGNNDQALAGQLPHTAVVDVAGVSVGLVHDSGRSQGRASRLQRMFPGCPVVVFGHSHVPLAETGIDGQLLFNPGSPTQRRRQPHPTFGILELHSGRVLGHRLVAVGR